MKKWLEGKIYIVNACIIMNKFINLCMSVPDTEVKFKLLSSIKKYIHMQHSFYHESLLEVRGAQGQFLQYFCYYSGQF